MALIFCTTYILCTMPGTRLGFSLRYSLCTSFCCLVKILNNRRWSNEFWENVRGPWYNSIFMMLEIERKILHIVRSLEKLSVGSFYRTYKKPLSCLTRLVSLFDQVLWLFLDGWGRRICLGKSRVKWTSGNGTKWTGATK